MRDEKYEHMNRDGRAALRAILIRKGELEYPIDTTCYQPEYPPDALSYQRDNRCINYGDNLTAIAMSLIRIDRDTLVKELLERFPLDGDTMGAADEYVLWRRAQEGYNE